MDKVRILVMAGAAEAHAVVKALVARGVKPVVSLPEPERSFGPFPVPADEGRFRDDADFAAHLAAKGIGRVIDASHAFEADLSAMVARVCKHRNIPYLRVLRAPWQPEQGDRWQRVADVVAACRAVRPGARVFATTGRASLPGFAGFAGERLFLRQTEAPRDALPDFVTPIVGPAPFSAEEEQALFTELEIDQLICRNVGGAPSKPKVQAARALGIEVLMLDQPAPPAGSQVAGTPEAAVQWACA